MSACGRDPCPGRLCQGTGGGLACAVILEIHGSQDPGRGNRADPNIQWGEQELGPGEFRDTARTGSWPEPICAQQQRPEAGSHLRMYRWGNWRAFLEVYRKMGGQYEGKSGTLRINGRKAYAVLCPLWKPESIRDFLQICRLLLWLCSPGIQGESRHTGSRFLMTGLAVPCQMRKMGAHIEITGNTGQ